MKTKAMKHQLAGLKFLAQNKNKAALGAEQGTGKTWMLLADLECAFKENRLDGALVIAPKGVHTNWVVEEVPKHFELPYDACAWSPVQTAKYKRVLDKFMQTTNRASVVKIFAMNVDAVNTQRGYAAAEKFLMQFRSSIIIDESHTIKNPDAIRTRKLHALSRLAHTKRIASGTLVANSPLDLYGQYTFLDKTMFGTYSYRAFVSQYAEVLPPTHPMIVELLKQNPKMRGTPQIIKRNKDGQCVYKNIDRLSKIISPMTFRVTKEECLDLPAKIYKKHFFELTKEQYKIYNQIRDELCLIRDSGDVDVFTALTAINKLRQVASGFLIMDGSPAKLRGEEPKLNALEQCIELNDGPYIIWASHTAELRHISERLNKKGLRCAVYFGGTSNKDRAECVKAFQSGELDCFIGNPAAGGTGITLNKARSVIYYSCSYSLSERLQSEDRAHRIGTKHNVVYTDMVATGTIDEAIANALQNKLDIALSIYSKL